MWCVRLHSPIARMFRARASVCIPEPSRVKNAAQHNATEHRFPPDPDSHADQKWPGVAVIRHPTGSCMCRSLGLMLCRGVGNQPTPTGPHVPPTPGRIARPVSCCLPSPSSGKEPPRGANRSFDFCTPSHLSSRLFPCPWISQSERSTAV
jgi:hypothetical protein